MCALLLDEIDDDIEAEEVDHEPEPEATLQDMLNKGSTEDGDEYGYGFDEEEY